LSNPQSQTILRVFFVTRQLIRPAYLASMVKTTHRSLEMNEPSEIPPAEYKRAKRRARAYIRRHYPAYINRIVSFGGSPRGQFILVFIALSPYDVHKVRVPNGRFAQTS
jgi:hypothetical protein